MVFVESSAYQYRRYLVGSQIKIVWNVTGSGMPKLVLSNPVGAPAALLFGPELHPGSTRKYPGSEYGSGFVPDASGCWRLTIHRGALMAAVAFEVST